jgi:hypothetical protein
VTGAEAYLRDDGQSSRIRIGSHTAVAASSDRDLAESFSACAATGEATVLAWCAAPLARPS